MKTREDHLQFIKLNMTAVAACAWTGFKAKGRGIVCVFCDQHNEGTQTVPFDWTPEQNVSQIIKPWYGTKESRMVAEYAPETEVIVGFIRSKRNRLDFDCYRFKPNPTPPVAAEML